MADRRLSDIEDLVEASVFNPSPCRRLRERILHDAVRATRSQQRWQRALPFVLATMGIAVVALFSVRLFKHAPIPSKPVSAAQIQIEATQTGSPSSSESSSRPQSQPSSDQSLGQALYSGYAGQKAEARSEPAVQPELTTSHQ
jgi:hypothetical protein